MNTAAKGRRQEHRSMAIFEREGFTCIRSAASKGLWDFVAFSDWNIVLVQVRSTRWPSRAEMAALKAFRTPRRVIREVHRWKRNARKPDVRVIA